MPDPIIEPMTSMVALVRPSALTNSRSAVEVSGIAIACLASTLNRPPVDRVEAGVHARYQPRAWTPGAT